MESMKNLNYFLARATLLCWEEKPSNFCWHFLFIFIFIFAFVVSHARVCCFGYREAFVLVVLVVYDSLLVRFCSCCRPYWCHRTWKIFHPATFLACIDVVALQSPALSSPSSTCAPVAPNPLDTPFVLPTGHLDPCTTVAPRSLDVLLRVFVYTPWSIWMFTPCRDVLVPSARWASIFFLSFSFVFVFSPSGDVPFCLLVDLSVLLLPFCIAFVLRWNKNWGG